MPRRKFLHQRQVVDRLAFDAKKLLRDRVERPAVNLANERWSQVQHDIAAFAQGVWAQMGAAENPITAQGAKKRISDFMVVQLRGFREWVIDLLNDTKRNAYSQQFYVDHWILDQVTPPNVKVVPKRDPATYQPTGGFRRKIGAKESKAGDSLQEQEWYEDPGFRFGGGASGGAGGGAGGGAEWWDEPAEGKVDIVPGTLAPIASHEMRLDFYLKAFAIAAGATGLAYAAIQSFDAEDVASMILNATTKGQKMENVLSRLIKTEIQVSIADSDDQFSADYEDLLKRRYWKTMEDERVCPICRPNEGRTEARATHSIPAHPDCRCYWRIEPVSFKTLAGLFGVGRLGSGTMAVRNPETGEVTGTMVIDFDGWKQALPA